MKKTSCFISYFRKTKEQATPPQWQMQHVNTFYTKNESQLTFKSGIISSSFLMSSKQIKSQKSDNKKNSNYFETQMYCSKKKIVFKLLISYQ